MEQNILSRMWKAFVGHWQNRIVILLAVWFGIPWGMGVLQSIGNPDYAWDSLPAAVLSTPFLIWFRMTVLLGDAGLAGCGVFTDALLLAFVFLTHLASLILSLAWCWKPRSLFILTLCLIITFSSLRLLDIFIGMFGV